MFDSTVARKLSVSEANAREQGEPSRPTLYEGHKIKCPRCETPHEIIANDPAQTFKRLGETPKYMHETVPVLKCRNPKCHHVFALKP